MVPAFCDQFVAQLVLNLAQRKENSKFHYILSEKRVQEDFTLYGLQDFNKCTNKCNVWMTPYCMNMTEIDDECW